MIKQLLPVELPEDICWWFHPDIQFIDPLHNCNEERGYTTEEWETIQANGNINIEIDTSYDGWDIEEAIGDTDGHWTGWKPTPPTPDHFLIAAFDTEHIECVLWWAKQRNPEDQQHE